MRMLFFVYIPPLRRFVGTPLQHWVFALKFQLASSEEDGTRLHSSNLWETVHSIKIPPQSIQISIIQRKITKNPFFCYSK